MTLLALALAGSLGLNWLLFRFARARYAAEQQVRLDPTGAEHFAAANAELGPPRSGRPRVVFFGDSRIARWSPPPALGDAEIVNRGWGGETTAQALLRVERDVLALQPALVVIQSGINDLKSIGLLPEQETRIVEGCAERLEQIVARIRARNIPVVLLTIFPVGRVPPSRWAVWSDRTLDGVHRVNEGLERLRGPGVSLIECDVVLADEGRLKRHFAHDELHLTSPAYEALDRHVEPAIVGLLTRADSPPD